MDPHAIKNFAELLNEIPALMQEEKYNAAGEVLEIARQKINELRNEPLLSKKMTETLSEKLIEAWVILRFYPFIVSCRKIEDPFFLPAMDFFFAHKKENVKKGLVSGLMMLKRITNKQEFHKNPKIAEFCKDRLSKTEKIITRLIQQKISPSP